MFEAERFEKVLIDNDRASGNDRIHHVVLDEIDNDLFQAGGKDRAGQAKNDRAIFVAQHHVIDLRGPAEIARRECHLAHRLDEWDDIVFFDVDLLDDFN